ncbi:uncharacterized protein LOC116848930 [Odontomachus brunneus]|uniref:uncharacterized protein LOC116848930 n=1 Tax=Odontomachus brunneus TaxID=486640 RepID=UPI0013F1B3FB|nr:uncharacterized protein LOC116848930 [Odontomachus brunneus]XP_032681452.1 uncharacterized protein LOC116848930 [Odontomachus brunneus]XP_032681453.1 uncharacterized protein LOC116848930 [Odontomachus brunneus]XP_032681454.1 uncharacterized protein LOC116848930 [Odontomachus brunneus]XP_032681455.1 uncharacterized protein LOC116848930 [Odontomachus brunneus]
MAGGETGGEAVSERRKMGATKYVLGSAILGLFWSSLLKGVLTNSTSRCDYPPCSCDHYGRLNCDCKEEGEELILTTEGDRRLSPHTSRIVVSNCSSVILTNSSLASMVGLRSVDLVNVANLSLVRQSFELSAHSARTRISVRNSSIDVMPSFVFRGDVEAITFENVRIGQLSAFSFANLVHTDTLRLENCRIETTEAQAFKKFDVGYLHVIGGSFGEQVPSRTMNDIEVYHKFMLDGVRMGVVRSDAFIVRSPRTVAIQNCAIDTLESEAFDVTAHGAVIVKNNTFGSIGVGAFLGIRADREIRAPSSSANGLHDLIFKNNSVNSFEEGSLMFDRTSFRPELDNLLVAQACDCQMLPVWKNNVLNYSNVYSRFYARQNSLAPPTLQPQEPINETPETFLCLDARVEGVPTSFTDYEARHCSLGGSMLIFILIIAAALLALIVAVCLIVWCCRRRRRNNRKKWISVPTNAPDVVSKKNGVIGREAATSGTPVDSRITMVVPDGRLYRETEFHVIVEKAEPLTTEL